MATDFSDFHETVTAFMSEFGFSATYLKQGAGTYDPATSQNTAVVTEIPVQAILLDLTLKSNGLGTEAGSLIQAGDKQMFVRPTEQAKYRATPLGVNPTGDRVQVGTVTYKIVTFKEINTTASEQILIELYIRR